MKKDYSKLSDDEMRTIIKKHLNLIGHTYKDISKHFGISLDTARRLLTDLRRYRYIHVKSWRDEDFKWVAIYVKGKGTNAPKPISVYKTMPYDKLSKYILGMLPLARKELSNIVGISPTGLIPILNKLVSDGKVVRSTVPLGSTTKIVFYRKGECPGVSNEEMIVSTRTNGLTIPWEGYNIPRHDTQFKTVWRHIQ